MVKRFLKSIIVEAGCRCLIPFSLVSRLIRQFGLEEV